MKIGIPRALMFYYFKDLWLTFFRELGVETIISPETNKDIVKRGVNVAVDEGCFSSKVFLGHVDWLAAKCDMVFVPRIEATALRQEYCTRIYGVYDLVKSTFPKLKLLHCDTNVTFRKKEKDAFLSLGVQLEKTPEETLAAYEKGLETMAANRQAAIEEQNKILEKDGLKVLFISHSYNTYDPMIGKDVVKYFKDNNIGVIDAGIVNEAQAREKTAEHYRNRIYWRVNNEIIGGLELYKDKIDGIVLISTFPCGPDSIFGELIIRKYSHIPTLSLVIDELDASAGMQTRLESFVDLLHARKSGVKYAN